MKRDNNELISKEDLEIVEKIASKYNLNLAEFGRTLSRKKNTYPPFQFTCNENEWILIKEKADKLGMSASGYCVYAFEEFLSDENINNLNLLEIYEKIKKNRKGKDKSEIQTKRMAVFVHTNSQYLKAKEIANNLSVPVSTLIRYCACNL